jgi:predicted O-methyltransferase YrrM
LRAAARGADSQSDMTPQETWNAVDHYVSGLMMPPDPVLDAALADSAAAGLPPINVSPVQGRFLMLLARSHGARSILEIGTLGGYSTIWLARGLPKGGRLVTLEFEPRHAAVAKANLSRAGLGSVVEVRVGRALDTLPGLDSDGLGPFDFIFIDADKEGYPDYLPWAIKLSRPGTLIVADNVVRKGAVADASGTDPHTKGIRRFHELVAAEPRLTATVLQTVGSKGHDGFLLALVDG